MDTNFCYGQIPALTRDKYAENPRPDHQGVGLGRTVCLRREVQPASLRELCWPKPIQQPHRPVYIPAVGSIETWDFCLDHDYNYSYLSFSGYRRGKALLDGYWDRVPAARDKDDSPNRAALCRLIRVADTDAEAERLYAEHILYFYNRCLHVFPGFAGSPGLPDDQHHQGGVAEPAHPGRDAAIRESHVEGPGRGGATYSQGARPRSAIA